jgi:fatty-acyl-CoA synthase
MSDDNIGCWLRDHGQRTPDKPALGFEDGRGWTYSELDRWTDALADMLREVHGVERGDRVAFLGYNNPAIVALLFAFARLGAILVPLNWRLTGAELAFIVEDCAPKALYFEPEFAGTAAQIGDAVSGCELAAAGALDAAGGDAQPFDETGCRSDPLLIIYTSGTTGRPKGAVLTQQALEVNALNSIDMHQMTSGDRVLVVLPLFHVGGLNISLTPALFCGAEVELHARFEPAATLQAVERYRPDILVLVPATMMAVMRLANWATADTSSLRMLTTGSMVVPVELIAAYEDKGISVVQVYGSTETCPIAAYTQPGEGRSNPSSTGKAALHSQVRIAGSDGAPARAGVDGEIEVLGEHVMTGYWQRPDETKEAFNGVWHRTGDIGHLDADGNLYFCERKKHMIVSGGENIYPAEVERVISAIPGVSEVAVCGMADERWGEVPGAAIVLADGIGLDEAAVRAVLKEQLARFKHPKSIVFLDELPRNAMGKVVHADLRKVLVGSTGKLG